MKTVNTRTAMRIIYFVLGLGCESMGMVKAKEYHEQIQKYTHVPIHLRCDLERGHSIKEIIKTSLRIKPQQNTTFIDSLYHEISHDLHLGKQVLVVGSSYGGLIVSQIAKIFSQKEPYVSRLKFVTFASIYIPKSLPHVDIIHVMHFNDISLVVNKLKQPPVPAQGTHFDADKNVLWVDMLVKQNDRWFVHQNGYDEIIMYTLRQFGISKDYQLIPTS